MRRKTYFKRPGVRRSYRTRRIAEVAARVDRRATQRMEGLWDVFDRNGSVNTSNASNVKFSLSLQSAPDDAPKTIYGMDSLISLSVGDSGISSPKMCRGVLTGTIIRKASDIADVPNPLDASTANRWPWRFWHNFHLYDASDENPLRALTVPFRFRYNNRIVLPDQASFYLVLALGPQASTMTININWSGRYRYIKRLET